MSWLFPHRCGSEQHRRLDAVLAENHLANEALSQASQEASASARENRSRAQAITDASRERLREQEERRRRRIETMQEVLSR